MPNISEKEKETPWTQNAGDMRLDTFNTSEINVQHLSGHFHFYWIIDSLIMLLTFI